ncbi:hypothetical protein PRO82_000294 [Candidatus Protochlamydia amoebophila]|nr:hypothetical protein [Candidatus Protochlamydia amoebophila]
MNIRTVNKRRNQILAKDQENSFAKIWKNSILERFLARLSQSHKNSFILKGGTLLAKQITIVLFLRTKTIKRFLFS